MTIKSGPEAVKHVQERERLLREAAEALSVPEDQLKATAMRFFNEWKERGKEIEKLSALLSHAIADNAMIYAMKDGRKLIELDNAPYTQKLAEEVCAKLSAQGLAAVISIMDGFIVAVAPKGSGSNALELIKKHGGKGGGSEQFARGKVQ